jgi:hypothetical protein
MIKTIKKEVLLVGDIGGTCDKNISSGSNQSVNGILMHAAVHLEKE